MNSSTGMWIVVAVLAFILLSKKGDGSGSASGTVSGQVCFRAGGNYPLPGPSPSGTSYAQTPPAGIPPARQTNQYDTYNTAIAAGASVITKGFEYLSSLNADEEDYSDSFVNGLGDY